MQDLLQKLEAAGRKLVNDLELSCAGRNVTAQTGLNIEDKALPAVTVVASSGNEYPQGSGNYTVQCSVVVITNAVDTTVLQHRELCTSALAPFLDNDDSAADLSTAVPDFAVIGISNRQCSERVEDSSFITELSFDCYCCGLSLV